VWIKAGPTGLDPKQTGFFQNLSIQTKIVKTQIEIVADKKIVNAGQKIETSHAALLDKLKIRPFHYKMDVKCVYDQGQIFDASILDITSEDIVASFKKTIADVAAISMESGYLTKPAIPHLLANAFKNLAAVSFETDFSFKQAEKMKKAAKEAVIVAPVGGQAAPKDADKPKEEEKEEEIDADMGDLFGGEY